MAPQSLVTSKKRKNKQIRSKEKCAKPFLDKVNIPICSSLLVCEDVKSREIFIVKTRVPATTNEKGESIPIQYQTFLLPNEYMCTDFTEDKYKKWNLFSCFCCKNYKEDTESLLKGRCQYL